MLVLARGHLPRELAARVGFRSGPLAGLKGKIVRASSGKRFVVQVDFIQKSASVLLDDFTLAAVESPTAQL